MLKFIIKVSDKKNGACKVDFTSPTKDEFDKAKDSEKNCAIAIQQKLMKALEDLQNE